MINRHWMEVICVKVNVAIAPIIPPLNQPGPLSAATDADAPLLNKNPQPSMAGKTIQVREGYFPYERVVELREFHCWYKRVFYILGLPMDQPCLAGVLP